MNDNVNHPSHYTQGPVHDRCGEVVECITVTEGMNFNVGNAVKYLWRCDAKDNGQNAIQDLEKARWYITREIERRQYEAARNEPPLFEDDDVKPARDFTWKDFLNGGTIEGARIQPDPYGITRKSGHTHLGGHTFDVRAPKSRQAEAFTWPELWRWPFGTDTHGPQDEGQADEPGPVTLDDTNSHVCVNGKRVPGTECGFRRLFGDTTGTGV